MADELGKKKPDLGAGSSSTPAPKQVSAPKPAASNPASAPKAANLNAPKQPKVDTTRQKIMNQGFAPKNYSSTNQKLQNWGKKNKKYVDQKSTSDYYDDNPDFWAIGEDDIFQNEDGSYRVERKGQQIGSYKNDDELFKYLDETYLPKKDNSWNIDNNPGSAVTTKELEDFTRDYLTKAGGLSDKFINEEVAKLSQNSRKADFYKQKMKDAYEKEQASKSNQNNPYLDEINKYGGTIVGNDEQHNNYEVTKDGDKFYANTHKDSFDGPNEDAKSPIVFQDNNGNDVEGFDSFDEIMDALYKSGYLKR